MRSEPFNLRSFLSELEAEDSTEIWRIKEHVNLDFDVTAVAMELERVGKAPVLWFENVADYPFPVVANVFGSRHRFAKALGVSQERLLETWSKCGDTTIEPVLSETGPVQDIVLTGADVDLNRLPIMKHFQDDSGRYITNAVVVARDPETGVRNASFHRMQVKGPAHIGTSLHSRRHLWNYVQRAEERNEDLPIAVIIGSHPLITFGGLWKGGIDMDEYAVVGGLMEAPLALVPGCTVPVEVPAEAEIVLEGRILANRREPEGPFAEFTGYSSKRSTQHVIEISAITHRTDAIYQDIIPGMSDEHTGLLGAPQEARLLRTLRQHYPNVTAVSYPKSGTCRLHAYIAMRNPAPGQARNAAAAALGDDLSLKLVVVVGDDVDVRNDREVLWAMATRMQADQDVEILRNCMGAILDPSNRDGLTAKMIIDATQPGGEFATRHRLPPTSVERALAIIARAGSG